MNVTFSVPQFPQYKHTQGHDEYVKHELYMKRFQAYAVASLKMQVQSFEKAAEILAVGDGSRAIEVQMLKMGEVVTSLTTAANGIVERSTLAVEEEVAAMARNIRLDVERVVSESASETKTLLGSMRSEVVDGSADVCTERRTCGLDAGANVSAGKNNRRNRLRREKRRTKQSTSDEDATEVNSVQHDASGVAGRSEQAVVPEWRRRDPSASFHKGVFSGCPSTVQDSLRDSRAEMLIAKNKTAAAEAEAKRRQVEAKLKSRLLEEEVERSRLEHEKKMKVLRAEGAAPQGFAETIVTALETPSLSDGSISPDSSISVAEVHAKDRAIRLLISQCTEKNSELEKLKARIDKLERYNNNVAF